MEFIYRFSVFFLFVVMQIHAQESVTVLDSVRILSYEKTTNRKTITIKDEVMADSDVITVKSSFTKAGSNEMWGDCNTSNFINSTIKFRKTEFSQDTIKVYSLDKNSRGILRPLTYVPSEFYGTGHQVYHIINYNTHYYILDTGPFGCQGSGCGSNYYLVFTVTGKNANLYAIEHLYSQPIAFNDNLFTIINGKLTVYLFEEDTQECGFAARYAISKTGLIKISDKQKLCWE